MAKNDNVDKALQAQCICVECPSYVECGEPLAYCLVEPSKCIKTEQGCICGGCPVFEKMNFDRYYYCLR